MKLNEVIKIGDVYYPVKALQQMLDVRTNRVNPEDIEDLEV